MTTALERTSFCSRCGGTLRGIPYVLRRETASDVGRCIRAAAVYPNLWLLWLELSLHHAGWGSRGIPVLGFPPAPECHPTLCLPSARAYSTARGAGVMHEPVLYATVKFDELFHGCFLKRSARRQRLWRWRGLREDDNPVIHFSGLSGGGYTDRMPGAPRFSFSDHPLLLAVRKVLSPGDAMQRYTPPSPHR